MVSPLPGVADVTMRCPSVPELPVEEPLRHGLCVVPAKANHADGALARWGRHGDDGVPVHGGILWGVNDGGQGMVGKEQRQAAPTRRL